MARVLLITGAGASTALGAGKRVPLMAEFSDALVAALNDVDQRLAPDAKLAVGLDGEIFERRLGDYLRAVDMLPLLSRYPDIGLNPVVTDKPSRTQLHNYVSNWFGVARNRSDAFGRVLNSVLYREFGDKRRNAELARSVYGELLKLIGWGQANVSLTVATTNYDLFCEVTLKDLGVGVDDGVVETSHRTFELAPWEIVPFSPGRVSVLHLHGAVGWYRTDSSVVEVDPGGRDFDDRRQPALLYPDIEKNPWDESGWGANVIWEKFEKAASEATHIVFLGHSLHDEPILRVVRGALENGPTVLIGVYEHASSEETEEVKRKSESIDPPYGGAELIPVEYGVEGGLDLLGDYINSSA